MNPCFHSNHACTAGEDVNDVMAWVNRSRHTAAPPQPLRSTHTCIAGEDVDDVMAWVNRSRQTDAQRKAEAVAAKRRAAEEAAARRRAAADSEEDEEVRGGWVGGGRSPTGRCRVWQGQVFLQSRQAARQCRPGVARPGAGGLVSHCCCCAPPPNLFPGAPRFAC